MPRQSPKTAEPPTCAYDSDEEREKHSELFSAIKIGDVKKVQALLNSGIKTDIVDKNNKNYTPFHYAVDKEQTNVVQILLNDENTNINAQSGKGDTPLHIAIFKSNIKISKLLLQDTKIDVNVKNNDGKMASDVAKEVNCKEIMAMLKECTKNSTSKIYSQKDVSTNVKCKYFVIDFVRIFEKTISDYYERIENYKGKPGKTADFIKNVIALTQGGTEGIDNSGGKAMVNAATNVISMVITIMGNKYNRSELKKLLDLLYTFKNHQVKSRKDLITSGTEIFEKFERQFDQVTADNTWQRAMTKLAEDAVGRVIDYFRKNTEEFNAKSITKGVILGHSKKFKNTSNAFSHFFTSGHTLQVLNSKTEWNTADLFDMTGLVTLKNDGSIDTYFKKKGEKSDKGKYGHRLYFAWEDIEKNYEKIPYQESYTYNLFKSSESLIKAVEKDINEGDPNLMEERLSNEIKNITKSVEEYSEEFQTFIEENYSQLNSSLNLIQNVLENHANDSKQNHSITHEQLATILERLEKITSGEKDHDVKSRPAWFEVEKSTDLFTGREEELDLIESYLKEGPVVISGLGGIGKSELAKKYVEKFYNHQTDTVIKINSETQSTAKDSFIALLIQNDKKTTDPDNNEMKLKLMAINAYKYFAVKNSLILLDNATEYSIIKEFLPPSNSQFRVLITSQNNQLLSGVQGNVKILNLKTLLVDEATWFVKEYLNIQTTEQDVQVTELVGILGQLPLALVQVVAYIKESGFDQNIKSCVNLLKESENDIQNILNHHGSSGLKKSIFLCFHLALNSLKDKTECELATDILNSIAYFASENIPKEVLFKLAENKIYEEDGDVKKTSAAGMLNRAINLLKKYSLISSEEFEKEKERLKIHSLLQEVVRSNLRQNVGSECEKTVLQQVFELLRTSDNAASCIPHIISIWNHAYKYNDFISRYIVDENNNRATTLTTHFHLVVEGCSYKAISTILNEIRPEKLDDVINAKSKYNETPLHKAVFRDDEKIALLLINKGANVHAKKRNGWSSLHFAANNGYLDVVNALLANGAIVDDLTRFEFTPLHLAARNGYEKIVDTLLKRGAEVNAKTDFAFTPLHQAAQNGHSAVVEVLLNQRNILVNAETKDTFTSLHFAAKIGQISIVKALMDKKADVSVKNKGGLTALHFAALNGHTEIIEALLLGNRTIIDAKTSKGNTALHLAAEKGNLETVKLLIEQNIDTGIQNEDGNTAADLAFDSNVKEIFLSTFKRPAM